MIQTKMPGVKIPHMQSLYPRTPFERRGVRRGFPSQNLTSIAGSVRKKLKPFGNLKNVHSTGYVWEPNQGTSVPCDSTE